MGITVSTWSGTYNTQVTLALPHPSPTQPGAATDETPAARTTYSEYDPPVTSRKLCSVKYLPAYSQDHETEIEITGPDPESIRAFLLEMLAGLPEPPMFTDGAVLTHIGGSERFLPTHTVIAPTPTKLKELSYEAGKGWH